ncbi:MAG: phytanoyl-CoA dioxygenase family protein, partial [Phenylobacterium sp.]
IRRGQGLDGFGDDEGVLLPLKAGELSMHNTRTVHASGPNDTADRRMGYGISFIPAHVRPTGAVRPSALLVRGEDRYGHFVPEQRLRPDASPAERAAAHAEACDRFVALQNAGFTPA